VSITLIPAIRAGWKAGRQFLPRTTRLVFRQRNANDDAWATVITLSAKADWDLTEKNETWSNRGVTENYLVLSLINQEYTDADNSATKLQAREILRRTEVIEFQDRRYKISRLHNPVYGAEPVFEAKLEMLDWTA